MVLDLLLSVGFSAVLVLGLFILVMLLKWFSECALSLVSDLVVRVRSAPLTSRELVARDLSRQVEEQGSVRWPPGPDRPFLEAYWSDAARRYVIVGGGVIKAVVPRRLERSILFRLEDAPDDAFAA